MAPWAAMEATRRIVLTSPAADRIRPDLRRIDGLDVVVRYDLADAREVEVLAKGLAPGRRSPAASPTPRRYTPRPPS